MTRTALPELWEKNRAGVLEEVNPLPLRRPLGRVSLLRAILWSDEKERLGEVLRKRGHVSAADLNTALQEQQSQARLVH